jgi:leucyl aminopeptidase
MKISITAQAAAGIKADVLVCAVGPRWRNELQAIDRAVGGRLLNELARQGFQGTSGESATFQTHGAIAAAHVVAAGTGDGAGSAPWYGVAQAVVSRAAEFKAASAVVALPPEQNAAAAVELLGEGLGLSDYRFTRFKSREPKQVRLATVKLAVSGAGSALRTALERGCAIARATCLARDLVNLPAANATPSHLAQEARAIGRSQKLTVKILDEAALKRLGMGGILGVAQGSAQPPRFLELVYKPARKATPVVALVGKGVTFDSGGLSLKPATGMESMKSDMAGAAALLGVMSVIRDLGPAAEVRAYIPAAENMPAGNAIRPGDVLTARNGRTIEVLNTDAEGRLILADAISWAVEHKPDVLIDLATLTGAVRAVLGPRYAAILGTDRGVVADLIAAGRECGEHLWELPLIDEYRSDIDSRIADIKNTGSGYAGTIVAALFLREFVGNVPWAHIDFSSTAITSKPSPGQPAGSTGFGVRTLLRWLRNT